MTTNQPNPGDRPSRLALDRFHTGELQGAGRAELEARIAADPEAQRHLDDLEAARARVRSLDVEAIRHKASSLADEVPTTPRPANQPGRVLLWLAPLVAVVAMALAVPIGWQLTSTTTEVGGVRLKGDPALAVFVLRGGVLHPYGGEALGSGDVVGFRISGADGSLVLHSVDASGSINLLYTSPERVGPSDQDLPATATLDGAQGQELFVASIGRSGRETHDAIQRAFREGGLDGVARWAQDSRSDVGVAVEKK